jgi:3-hydroxyacyl-[acyl-carrier-protein] dehydratase
VRFLLFDRVTSIEPGRHITAVRACSMQDESLNEHFPRRALVPGSSIVESMLQTLGWLVLVTNEFRVLPLFSMLEDCALPPDLQPGVLLTIEGTLLSTNRQGSVGRAEVRCDGKVVASLGRVIFAHFPVPDPAEVRGWFSSYAGLA